MMLLLRHGLLLHQRFVPTSMSSIPSATRPVDIALFGATGFTGSLIVAYLAYNYPTLNVALVGRDKIRLNALACRHQNANFDVCTIPSITA
ncbi:hypothetical protein FOZ63_008166 [Perkinsus olseni]|uniref:Saccharopine dehydrogenase NADP binding domain-containing protein n=1 Tax=Perkinsus olseni TaxID=32597 RepID=A0A7J6UKK9_PEROL|nr:hypothetical protein FOZ63_008166 [Perkinsus olseni]